MDCNLKIIFWNVRGLNSGAKRTAVRSVISAAAPTIVCLQETKLAPVSDAIVVDTLGPSVEDYFFLPADGTRGGILLAWQRDTISLSNPLIGEHHMTALVSSLAGEAIGGSPGCMGLKRMTPSLSSLSSYTTCASPASAHGLLVEIST